MKLTTSLKVIAAALAVVAPAASHATISVTTALFNYSQPFAAPPTTATSVAWANDSTVPGWSLFRQPEPGVAITQIGIDNGNSTVGAFYSYGAASSGERALGGLGAGSAYFGSPASGDPAGAIVVGFTNNSGQTIGSVTIGFDGEQWRNGGNANAQTMLLQYGLGASLGAVNWVTPGGSFNWSSPIHTAPASALNGNAAANRVAGLGGTVTGSWEDGDTFWIRWIERNDAGNDHGLAIDNFTLSTTPIPEPSSAALLAAGAALLGALRLRRRAPAR